MLNLKAARELAAKDIATNLEPAVQWHFTTVVVLWSVVMSSQVISSYIRRSWVAPLRAAEMTAPVAEVQRAVLQAV